jgi:nucleotide-binding universal stress UspA family protein
MNGAPAVYRTVIAAHAGDELSADGLALARLIAGGTGARLVIAHVIPPSVSAADGPWIARRHVLRERADAEQLLEGLRREPAPDLEVETRLVEGASAPRGLHDLAEAEDADLIVLGSCHRGPVGRVLMGSVAERLLQGAPCAVAVAPRGYAASGPEGMRRIAVAFDASPQSKAALDHAAALAAATGARLRLIAAVEPVVFPAFVNVPSGDAYAELIRTRRKFLEDQIESASATLSPDVPVGTRVVDGNAADAIGTAAGFGVDLLVVGSRGWGPVRRVLLGSVSARLLRVAPCPVLVVPRAADAGDGLEGEPAAGTERMSEAGSRP